MDSDSVVSPYETRTFQAETEKAAELGPSVNPYETRTYLPQLPSFSTDLLTPNRVFDDRPLASLAALPSLPPISDYEFVPYLPHFSSFSVSSPPSSQPLLSSAYDRPLPSLSSDKSLIRYSFGDETVKPMTRSRYFDYVPLRVQESSEADSSLGPIEKSCQWNTLFQDALELDEKNSRICFKKVRAAF